jgi:hypothetical protein
MCYTIELLKYLDQILTKIPRNLIRPAPKYSLAYYIKNKA